MTNLSDTEIAGIVLSDIKTGKNHFESMGILPEGSRLDDIALELAKKLSVNPNAFEINLEDRRRLKQFAAKGLYRHSEQILKQQEGILDEERDINTDAVRANLQQKIDDLKLLGANGEVGALIYNTRELLGLELTE